MRPDRPRPGTAGTVGTRGRPGAHRHRLLPGWGRKVVGSNPDTPTRPNPAWDLRETRGFSEPPGVQAPRSRPRPLPIAGLSKYSAIPRNLREGRGEPRRYMPVSLQGPRGWARAAAETRRSVVSWSPPASSEVRTTIPRT